MSITWRSFDVLFCLMCVCVCHIMYVSWCSWSMSTHGYNCEHRECNVIVSFCVISLSLCLFTLNLFRFWLLTALSVPPPTFLSFPHFVHYLCPVPPLFFLSVLLPSPPSLLCFYLFGSAFPSCPRPLPPPCWVRAQETSGLSPAVGCGRHGEDARAGLEVCVYVPAGVLQRSGDEGPG